MKLISEQFARKFFMTFSPINFLFTHASFRGRNGRALNKQQTKQIDDDANDFNDDLSLYDAISKAEGEGNVTEEGRGKAMKQGYKGNKKQGYGYDEEGYGYSGYGGYGNLTSYFVAFCSAFIHLITTVAHYNNT